MRAWVLAALLVAGCSGQGEKKSISALLESDQGHGNVTMTCRASSSGTCHALFVTGDKTQRLSAPANNIAELTGVGAGTQYCLAPEPPGNGCKLSQLNDGRQIVRFESTRSE